MVWDYEVRLFLIINHLSKKTCQKDINTSCVLTGVRLTMGFVKRWRLKRLLAGIAATIMLALSPKYAHARHSPQTMEAMKRCVQVHQTITDKGEITASDAELYLKTSAAVVIQLEKDVLADLADGNWEDALNQYDVMVRLYKAVNANFLSLQTEIGKLVSLPIELKVVEKSLMRAAAAIKAEAQSKATALAKELTVLAGKYVYKSGDFHLKATVTWKGSHPIILITWRGKRAPSPEEWNTAKKGKPEELNDYVMFWVFKECADYELQFQPQYF